MDLTNRDIVGLGHFTLPQVRRWAVLVLGKDPEAEKGKGVKRVYNIDEAFKIYLAGILITVFKMGLKETQDYINNFWPFMKDEELLPSQILEKIANIKRFDNSDYIHFDYYEMEKIPKCYLILYSKGIFELKIILKEKKIGWLIHEETYKNICSNKPIALITLEEGLPQWHVPLDKHLLFFLRESIGIYNKNLVTKKPGK